jgi:hypothetical protein
VALEITDVSEEYITSIIKVKRISELGTISEATSNYEEWRLLGCYAVWPPSSE